MKEKIGEFSSDVVKVLNLDVTAGTAIYIGETNIRHMKERHPRDFRKYFNRIEKIVSAPDYVGISPDDASIEFIKELSKNVKVAVRIAGDGDFYARSLYEIHANRVSNFIKDRKLFVIDKTK